MRRNGQTFDPAKQDRDAADPHRNTDAEVPERPCSHPLTVSIPLRMTVRRDACPEKTPWCTSSAFAECRIFFYLLILRRLLISSDNVEFLQLAIQIKKYTLSPSSISSLHTVCHPAVSPEDFTFGSGQGNRLPSAAHLPGVPRCLQIISSEIST